MNLDSILHLAARARLVIEHDAGGDITICGRCLGTFYGVTIKPDGSAYDLETNRRVDPMVSLRLHRLVPVRRAI